MPQKPHSTRRRLCCKRHTIRSKLPKFVYRQAQHTQHTASSTPPPPQRESRSFPPEIAIPLLPAIAMPLPPVSFANGHGERKFQSATFGPFNEPPIIQRRAVQHYRNISAPHSEN
jgi:hypothetical protein